MVQAFFVRPKKPECVLVRQMEVQSVVTFEAENLGMEVESHAEQDAPVFPPVRPSELQVNLVSVSNTYISVHSIHCCKNSQASYESPQRTLDGNLSTHCGTPQASNSFQHLSQCSGIEGKFGAFMY